MTDNNNDSLNRWSVYRGVNDGYVIIKELYDNNGKIIGYSYTHAVRDDDDLEEFIDLADNGEIDELFK